MLLHLDTHLLLLVLEGFKELLSLNLLLLELTLSFQFLTDESPLSIGQSFLCFGLPLRQLINLLLLGSVLIDDEFKRSFELIKRVLNRNVQ